MSVVDVSPVTDRLDPKYIAIPIPRDNCAIVPGTDLVIAISREALEAVFRPLGCLPPPCSSPDRRPEDQVPYKD